MTHRTLFVRALWSSKRCEAGAARGAARRRHKMAAAAEGDGPPPEEAPGERSGRTMERRGSGGNSDTDSDETVVQGSVTESDVEEEEFRRRRLAFLNKDIALTAEISINKGAFSPEICFTQKFSDRAYYHKEEQINPILQEAHMSDQSQSLLKGWINHSSPTENISKPGFSLNSAEEEQQNNSIDIKLNGFQKDSEEKISQKLSNEDCSLCLDAPVEDIVTVLKEQIPEDTFPHVLDNCHRTCMTIIGTDNTVKEHSLNNDTDLSLSSPGKIFMDVLTEQNIETSEVDISDLLRYPSDSESLKVKNPLPDKLECQDHDYSINPSASESSDALPVELVAPLNGLSGSVVQAATPAVPNEGQLNAKEEQVNSEPSVLQLDDDCTQIINVMEPQLATIQMEEINAFTGSNLQSTTNQQPVGGQQGEKEVISVYLDATFSEKQTGEGHSHSVKSAACVETAQTTSSKIQKSTSEDKQDLETIIWQEIILNEYAEAKQRRRSKRIDNKRKREAFGRNSVNPTRPLSLSTIHRRNAYGENLLHRAVIHQDIDLVHRIIKAGGKVNAQDYAGLTALHIASVEGFYGIANLLLKAGADVNATQREQITPLQDAVKEGHYEMANLLLWYGADPLLKNQMGRCALEETSDPSMRKLLKSYVAKSRRYSVAGGDDSKNMLNTQCIEDASQHQISLQTEESEPACANPQETRQKAKAASYSSSSNNKLSSNQSQLSQASEQQTSKKSESTREEAVIVHGARNTRAGRKMKIRRNEKGETQLHIAARRGDVSLVKTLISSGICVNEQDYAGWTAIHEASNRGFTDVILELLKAGADVNSRSLCGVLPIHDAVSGNYLEAVRILLQHGANPNERDGSGESALNQACDEEMKDLLKSYGATDSVLPVQNIEVTEGKSKHHCYDYYKNDYAALEPQHEKYSVESVAAIQDTEKKQEELLLFELRTSKDADLYMQSLSQIQHTLNEILANQKTERDTLAKKYRASVESFKKGALRKQLVNLAFRQKSLLTVAQNQEKLVQKIQNCRKTKQMFSSSSEKQISNLVIFHGSDTRQSLTADEIMCPNAVTFSMGLGANTPNEKRVEAHVSPEKRFSAQECIQQPHIYLNKTGADEEALTSKGASDHALASENRLREYPFDNMSKLTNAAEVMTLPSEPAISTIKTKCSEQKDIDCVATVEQGNKYLNLTSMTNTLNTVEPRSTVVNVCQTTSDCKQVPSHEDLHRYMNKKEAFQQKQTQQVILLASTKNFSNTLQQMAFQSNENSFNANLVLTSLTSNTDSPVNVSEKSSQSYSNQEWEQSQVRYGQRTRKKHQLIDLLELGRIKPGENVLEFKLQEFSYKATLLKNGKIRTSKGQILQNPVQWIKDILGSDISVTWKYVWNKVTYLGTELSKFSVDEVSDSSDLELPTQEGKPVGSSVQFNSVESLTHFLQFHETVLVHKEEFLPCSAMEKYWSFYKECKNFGF
ncbi:ankyrin repeat domain-containing protein 31 isoform X1 [Corvus cornix cornix]|uniref:ankyrin repeat domain-containing protein 31 isoform X1 n=2 Tax=Corvus cornix cornix TaxID=932674 RepID=UPI00195215D0|nr:ankyrin repeat domain-containing protein 31 isoform X1 [Corvus cornix cornix]XP_039423455.1 ankyrin repeat domain-containing protein 31 isoform X1 [Corvus cornix cornix]